MPSPPTVLAVAPPAERGRLEGATGLAVRHATGEDLSPERLAAADAVVVAAAAENWAEAVAAARDADPTLPVVVWSDRPDGDLATAATGAGATDYVALSALDEGTLAGRVREAATAGPVPDGDGTFDAAFETVSESIADGVVTVDSEGTIVYANDGLAALTGYDRETLLGGPLTRIMPERFHDAHQEGFTRYLRTGDRTLDWSSVELVCAPADGEQFPIEVSFGEFEHGGEQYFTGVIRDVSARRSREEILSGLVETSRELMAAETPAAVADLAVDAVAEVLGFDLNVVRRYDPESGTLAVAARSDAVEAVMDERPDYAPDEGGPGEAFSTGETVVYDRVPPTDDDAGQTMYLPLGDHGTLSIGTTEGGFDEAETQTAELLATTVEEAITRAEREQRLAEYETVIENVHGMLYVLDADGRFTMVTDPLAEWVGYEREEMLGEHVSLVLPDEEIERSEEMIAELIATGQDGATVESAVRHRSGERLPVKVDLAVLPFETAFRGSLGVVRDISALQATREELSTQSDRFRNLFEQIPDPVVEVEFVDGVARLRDANDAFESTFGYEIEAVTGEPINDLIVPPSERGGADKLDDGAEGGTLVTEELRRRTTAGVRTFLFRGTAFDVDDRTLGFGIYTDITEQKDRERRLEVLHRILRHNLRTEMTLLGGFTERLADRFDDPPPEVADVRDVADRVAAFSDEVRTIERALDESADRDFGPMDVVPTIEDVVARVRERFPAATVETDLPSALVATADERFALAVENLVENAVEHTPADATALVVAEREGDTVVVRVVDDGPGIPDHERAVVTGDREITKLTHSDGLGLWISAWIARALGGDLDLRDREGGGTVATLRLVVPEDADG